MNGGSKRLGALRVPILLRVLLAFGIKPREVRTMLQDNPAKLMWLD